MTRRSVALGLGVMAVAGALIAGVVFRPTPSTGQDPTSHRNAARESPPGSRPLEELPAGARVLPRPPEAETTPLPPIPGPSSPATLGPDPGRFVRIRSATPHLSSLADFEAYAARQHDLLAEVAGRKPEMRVLAGVTFWRPLEEEDFHAVFSGIGCRLGNIQVQAPRGISGWGGAEWMLPLEGTEEGLRASGELRPDEHLLGISYAEVLCPAASLLDVVPVDDVAIVDPGDLAEVEAVRESNPDAILDIRLPGSLYWQLAKLMGEDAQ